jgi:hypothetical protein
LKEELEHVRRDLKRNGYPGRFISNVVKSVMNSQGRQPKEAGGKPLSTIVIPYQGTASAGIARILKLRNIRVVFKPQQKLGSRLHKKREPRGKLEARCVVYKLKCKQCESVYIGQTGRSLRSRLREHERDQKAALARIKEVPSTELMQHVIDTGHQFDLSDPVIITKNRNYFDRLFVESFEIAKDGSACNSRESVRVPDIYKAL